MNSLELLTEVYRRREEGEATACQVCVSKCLSDKKDKGQTATDQDKAICFSECGCSNEQNGNGGGNGAGNGMGNGNGMMNGEPEPENNLPQFNRLFPFGRVRDKCPDGQIFSHRQNKCVKNEASELNDSDTAKIFNWMERKADIENEGEYWTDLARQAASQFGITSQQADNIWDSQGLEEVRGTELDDDGMNLWWDSRPSDRERTRKLKNAGVTDYPSKGPPDHGFIRRFDALPDNVKKALRKSVEGRPIKKGQTIAQWFNDMGRRGLADIGMDFQAGIMTPEFDQLSASQKRQVRMEFDEQKSIDSGFTKENCGCKFNKFAGESVKRMEKSYGMEVAFMFSKIVGIEGMKIKGKLAYAGVSHNNRLYLPEALQKGDRMELPMIFNHASPDGAEFELSRLPTQIRESILNHEHIRVGNVRLNWDAENLTLFYEGEVTDEFFAKEIDQGLMSVSLGMLFDADSPEICDQECYTVVKGAEFTEVSLVYHPGFPIATIESNEIRLKKRITPRRYKIE